jgi:uncharacterized protein
MGKMTMTDRTQLKVLREETVAPAECVAAEIRQEQGLRIVDVEGELVADPVTINANNLCEKLSVTNTISLNRWAFSCIGYVLYSDEAGGMMTIIADSYGVHDKLAVACSSYTNEKRYRVKHTRNCRDNLAAALKPWALGAQEQGCRLHRLPRRNGCGRCILQLPAGL